jgi:hypothetical protein
VVLGRRRSLAALNNDRHPLGVGQLDGGNSSSAGRAASLASATAVSSAKLPTFACQCQMSRRERSAGQIPRITSPSIAAERLTHFGCALA